MSETLKHLVVIDNGLLLSMAQQERFRQEFPFLRQLGPIKSSSCAPCGKAVSGHGRLLNSAKQALYALTGEKRAKLKELLNARQLRVAFVRNGNKRQKEVRTF